MTDTAIKKYVLSKEIWNALDEETKKDIFIKKQSESLMKIFLSVITAETAEKIAAYYMAQLTSPLTAAECKKIASFIINFYSRLSDNTVRSLYEALTLQENGKDPAEELKKDPVIAVKLTASGEAD